MHAIWDCWENGTKLDFRGEFYEHTLMTPFFDPGPVSYTHLRAHETVLDLVCRLLLAKKKKTQTIVCSNIDKTNRNNT